MRILGSSWARFATICPPVPIDAVRELSRKFRENTSVSVDGFHMRHFHMMSDTTLAILVSMFGVMEMAALVPSQVSVALLELIPKATAGFRPIGNFCALYRAYGKVRRPLAQQ